MIRGVHTMFYASQPEAVLPHYVCCHSLEDL
jgi:hypothetical protein